MDWKKHGGDHWVHPSYGEIKAQGGTWHSTNPAGEGRTFDTLDFGKSFLKALWTGWKKTGDREWTHRRLGRVFQGAESGKWWLQVRGKDGRVLGPYEQSDFAKYDSKKLSPIIQAGEVIHFAYLIAIFLVLAAVAACALPLRNVVEIALATGLVELCTNNSMRSLSSRIKRPALTTIFIICGYATVGPTLGHAMAVMQPQGCCPIELDIALGLAVVTRLVEMAVHGVKVLHGAAAMVLWEDSGRIVSHRPGPSS